MSGTNVYDLKVDSMGQPYIAAGCWTDQDVASCSPFVTKLSSDGAHQLYRERVSRGGNQPFQLSLTAGGEAVVSGIAGVSQSVDPWPSSWGLSGVGFVRVLDSSARTLAASTVNAEGGGVTPVYTSIGERLIVAFNTTSEALPTHRALPTDVDQTPGRDNPMAFAMALSGAGSKSTRFWATYLQDGTVFDVASTASGDAVVALVRWGGWDSVVTLVRIGQ
jgi:hypothetical protein